MKKILIFVAGVCLLLYPWVSRIVGELGVQEASVACEETIEDDVLGNLEIPKIAVNLPIYEGTEEDVLSKGVGHISWSSILTGEESSHCLLAGHRGLPGAELFTRLHVLEVGDLFSIHTKRQSLTYEVVTIQIIRPEDTGVLGVQTGRNLVSLVTCTPYGINTHRLIVTGERMEEK